jgi:hypothetical protein
MPETVNHLLDPFAVERKTSIFGELLDKVVGQPAGCGGDLGALPGTGGELPPDEENSRSDPRTSRHR